MTTSGTPGAKRGSGKGYERESWPQDFGRDGRSGLVGPGRAMRARDVSFPYPADETAAALVLAGLLDRVDGRPRGSRDRTAERRRA